MLYSLAIGLQGRRRIVKPCLLEDTVCFSGVGEIRQDHDVVELISLRAEARFQRRNFLFAKILERGQFEWRHPT